MFLFTHNQIYFIFFFFRIISIGLFLKFFYFSKILSSLFKTYWLYWVKSTMALLILIFYNEP